MQKLAFRTAASMAVCLISTIAAARVAPPCASAAASASGNVLVTVDAEYRHPLPAAADRVTIRVFSALKSEERELSSDGRAWVGPAWQVVLERSEMGSSFMSPCADLVVTDDGEYVVLIDGSGGVDSPALRIYRRPSRTGGEASLVKDLTVKELCSPNFVQLYEREVRSSGSWFHHSTFTFSDDLSVLIYQTPWRAVSEVRLVDGQVLRR